MRILVIDVGGTNVKFLGTDDTEPRRFPSGPTLTPEQMVDGVKDLVGPRRWAATRRARCSSSV